MSISYGHKIYLNCLGHGFEPLNPFIIVHQEGARPDAPTPQRPDAPTARSSSPQSLINDIIFAFSSPGLEKVNGRNDASRMLVLARIWRFGYDSVLTGWPRTSICNRSPFGQHPKRLPHPWLRGGRNKRKSEDLQESKMALIRLPSMFYIQPLFVDYFQILGNFLQLWGNFKLFEKKKNIGIFRNINNANNFKQFLDLLEICGIILQQFSIIYGVIFDDFLSF